MRKIANWLFILGDSIVFAFSATSIFLKSGNTDDYAYVFFVLLCSGVDLVRRLIIKYRAFLWKRRKEQNT